MMLIGSLVISGCQTAPDRTTANYARPFDAEKVAQLSHEAYKIAWDAAYWAAHDLRFAAFRPTELDWETVDFLRRAYRHAPFVAQAAEKHPAHPRDASRRAYNNLGYDALMLKHRYQPASFRPSTDRKIEKLLRVLDDIGAYYQIAP